MGFLDFIYLFIFFKVLSFLACSGGKRASGQVYFDFGTYNVR